MGWEQWIPIAIAAYNAMKNKESASGESGGLKSNVGNLTPEGRQLWDQYQAQYSRMPDSYKMNFLGRTYDVPNKRKIGLLKAMSDLESGRRGTLSNTPGTEGWLGKLAPLIAMMGKGKENDKNYEVGLSASGYDSGSASQGEDDYWRYGYDTYSGEQYTG